MKYWVSHLPLEVWVDVFRYPWITRQEMGRIVDRIGNYKFAEYLQFYLHDWGKRTLSNLWFKPGGLYLYQVHSECLRLDFPRVPLPENIRFFNYIQINHFNTQTLTFLRQIGPILAQVHLKLSGSSSDDMTNLRTILPNLLPLLNGGIHSLSFNARALPTVRQCFGDKLNKAKVLSMFRLGVQAMDEATVQATVNFLLHWLTAPAQASIGPRFCVVTLSSEFLAQIFPAIRQQFLSAKTPSPFALEFHLSYSQSWEQFAEFHLNNGIGEELHGVKKHAFLIHITGHRANCDLELQQEWTEEKSTWKDYGQISIQSPTIGLLDTTMEAPENMENQQMST